MGEAWELLEIHPATPELWKPNIKSFLARCLDEVPYISQWVWAVRQMRERLTAPASSKRYIKAPFRWFETVLRSKSRGRCSRDAKAAMTARKTGPMKEALETKRKWAKYFWLKAHQGKKAAHSYAIHAGLRAPHKLTIALKKMTAMMAETTRLARAGALDDHVPDAETVKIEMARAFAWHQERKAMHRMGWESLERTPEEEAGWWN